MAETYETSVGQLTPEVLDEKLKESKSLEVPTSAQLDRMIQKYGYVPEKSVDAPPAVTPEADVEDPKKSDWRSILGEAGAAMAEKPLFKTLNMPGQAVGSVLYRVLSNKGDLLGGALRGFKHTEDVTGTDIFVNLMSHVDPAADAAWRLKMASLGLDQGKFAQYVAQASPEEVDALTNPYGWKGNVAGFAIDVMKDPFTWLQGLAGGLEKAGLAKSGSAAALARDAATTVQKDINSSFSEAARVVYGSESPLMKRGVQAPTDVAAALQAAGVTSTATMDEVAQAASKMKAQLALDALRPQIAKAKSEFRVAARGVGGSGWAGPGKLLEKSLGDPDIDKAVTRYLDSYNEVGALAKKQADLEAIRGVFNSDKEVFLGVLATAPDHAILRDAANEIELGILGKAKEIRDLPDDVAPLQRAMTQHSYPGSGLSALDMHVRDIARLEDQLTYHAQPALLNDFVLPHEVDLDGMMAVREAERRAFPEFGKGIRLRGDADSPAMLAEIGRTMKDAGVPPQIAEMLGREVLVDQSRAEALIGMVRDYRTLEGVVDVTTPAELQARSQQFLGMSYTLSAIRRQIKQKLYVNQHGTVPVLDVQPKWVPDPTPLASEIPVPPWAQPSTFESMSPKLAQATTDMGAQEIIKSRTLSNRKFVSQAQAQRPIGIRDPEAPWQRKATLGVPAPYEGTPKPGARYDANGMPPPFAGVKVGVRMAGKGMLKPEEVKALKAFDRNLGNAFNQWFASERAYMLDSMESLFGTKAVLDPSSKVGQIVSNMPGLKKLTEHGYSVPTLAHLDGRDAFRVFKDTGVAERLFEASRTVSEGVHHYELAIDDIFKGFSLNERLQVQPILEGKLTADQIQKIPPKIADAAIRLRDLWHEGADLLQIPRENRISNYFTRVVEQYPQMKGALEKGRVPPDMMRDAPVIDEMLRRSDVGREWTSRFAKKRTATDATYELDPSVAAKIYFRSAMRAKYMGPAFKEAGDVLRGAQFRLGNPDYVQTMTKGVVDSPSFRAVRENMVSYLDELEREYHGQPISLDQKIHNRVSSALNHLRIDATPEGVASGATKISSAIVRNIYIESLGGRISTAFKNFSQNILTAAEHGPLNVLKAAAKLYAKTDPMEIAIHGGEPTKEGVRRLVGDELRRARLSWDEAFDVRRGWAGKARQFIDDNIIFGPMQVAENLNRGIGTYVGWTVAAKAGKSPYDVLRMGQRVANETQFLYGTFGRGPLFHSVYLKPVIGPFTSFPAKMSGAMGRMLKESPTSLLRFIGITGMMANIVNRMQMDPADMTPWGFLPDRLMGIFPQAGPAKFLTGAHAFLTSPEGSPEYKKGKLDMVNGFIYGGLLPVPAGFLTDLFQMRGLVNDDELRTKSELVKLLPGLDEFVFHHEQPNVVMRTSDRGRKAWLAVSHLILGFRDMTEADASQAMKMLKLDDEQKVKSRYLIENFVRVYGTLMPSHMTEDELKALYSMSPDQVRGILESVQNSTKTVFQRAFDAHGRRQQANVIMNIQRETDPMRRKEMTDLYLRNQATQRMLADQAKRRAELTQ